MVAEFDTREGCARFGLWSTARWLSHYCGIAHRTAVEHVRVAKALVAFPQLAREMSAGRLSYSQVRAISRAARDGEHRLVDDLIDVARFGTAAQLEVMVRGVTTADRVANDSVPDDDYLRTGWTQTGKWRLGARLAAEDGAIIDRAVKQLRAAEGCTGPEALVRMAEIALAVIGRGENTTHTLRGDERAAVVVHINTEQYSGDARSAERADAAGRIADGPGLPKRVIDRLACAGRVRTIVHRPDGSPLDVGRTHRVVTQRQFRALLDRDRTCQHPGCTSTFGLEAHHVWHWLDGGPTNMDNLVLLCVRHHHALHDGAFRIIALGRARFRFLRSDGRELLSVVPRGDAGARPIEDEIDTESTAPMTRWNGDRLDRDWAVAVLADRRSRARPVRCGQKSGNVVGGRS
jgi:hypothetical protein